MMEADFFLGGSTLLVVGDGDFSFSVALSRRPQFQAHSTISSSLETESSIKIHAHAVENMAILKKIGVSICLAVDARELHTHEVIGKDKYDGIIFNFPLAHRHNIKKNRALLADFFLSCRHILSAQGHVFVTLCKGQGGTPADQPMRSWHDSWQITAMATNAGFLLKSVIPFDASAFPEYHSVGFRFQDKSFHTSGALIHVFELADMIQDADLGIWGSVTHDDSIYSCSQYVATKMKRNLLNELCNPAALLKNELESCLNDAFKSCVHAPCPTLLPGCRSLAYIVKENKVDGYTMSDCDEKEVNLEMERKKEESPNKSIRQMLIHGIVNSDGEEYSRRDSNSSQLFLPIDDEAVYLLVRTSDGAINHNTINECGLDGPKKAPMIENTIEGAEKAGCHPYIDASNTMSFGTDQSSPVFHHRVSLLENVPAICNSFITSSHRQGKLMDRANFESHMDFCLHSSHEENLSLQFLEFLPCMVTSGQCMLPGPICKGFIPVKQELMVIHQLFDHQHVKMGLSAEHCTPSSRDCNCSDLTVRNIISANIISAFNTSKSLHLNPTFNISLQPCDSLKITLQGVDQCVVTNRLFLQSEDSTDSDLQKSPHIGYMIFVCIGDHSFHITLISITNFACRLWGVEDERLLWCSQEKFLSQFQLDASSSMRIMKLPSLYPLKFTHDISFWEKEGTVFDISSFYSIIRSVADDLVIRVSLVDTYFDHLTGLKSQCYRLHFQSCFQALTYQTSWKLQSRIRMEVAKTLCVTLR